MTENIAQHLTRVRGEIESAAIRAGRRASKIKLVAVSKTHPAESVLAALAAGQTAFGENKVQEAEAKIEAIGRDRAEWHLIGHLQSNKARRAVKLFDVVHSLDSLELAERIERLCAEENRSSLSVFVQVDLSGEATKNGIAERDLPKLIEFCGAARHLKLDGLMTLPPYFAETERVRPFFRRLRELRDRFVPGGELSMGMSHDFAVAIEEGATVIRIGTAIFGARQRGISS